MLYGMGMAVRTRNAVGTTRKRGAPKLGLPLLALTGILTVLAACGNEESRSDVTGGVTVARPADTAATGYEPPVTPTTDAESPPTLPKTTDDLRHVFPEATEAAEVFLPEMSGEYEIRSERRIGPEQEQWPWADGFVGGWERTYDLSTDVLGPMRRIAVTTQVLMFQSEADARRFVGGAVGALGPETVVGAGTSDDGNGQELYTLYETPGERLRTKSGMAEARGLLVIWTTFEDSEKGANWGPDAWLANARIREEAVSRYPDLG